MRNTAAPCKAKDKERWCEILFGSMGNSYDPTVSNSTVVLLGSQTDKQKDRTLEDAKCRDLVGRWFDTIRPPDTPNIQFNADARKISVKYVE
jgi:hypothetical protein